MKGVEYVQRSCGMKEEYMLKTERRPMALEWKDSDRKWHKIKSEK